MKKITIFKLMWIIGAVMMSIGFVATAFSKNIIFCILAIGGLTISHVGLHFKNKYSKKH